MFFNYSSGERTVNVALRRSLFFFFFTRLSGMKRPREPLGEAAGLQTTSSYSRKLVRFPTPVKLHLKKISGLCFLIHQRLTVVHIRYNSQFVCLFKVE